MDQPPNFRELTFEDVDGIGSGSFSQVAHIRGSDRVIKIPSNDAYEHHEREVAVYGRLGQHPHILRCYGVTRITLSGRTKRGLLLHYHEASTLDKILSAQKPCDSMDRDRWPIQAIEAVRHTHSRGIIHGDLGSHNLLVRSDGTLALADFGGSSIDGSKYLEFAPSRYSRPTIAESQSQPPTTKDDLYAFGTLLYEITTGQLLCQDIADIELSNVPGHLRRVMIGCWTEKYENAGEVARDLQGAVGSRPLYGFSPSSVFYFGLFSATLAMIWGLRSNSLHLPIRRRA